MALEIIDKKIVGEIYFLEEKLEGKIPIDRLELLYLINSWGRTSSFYINENIQILECKAKECYNLSKLDTSEITDMSQLFYYSEFNGDISNWNMSNVTDMTWMFSGAKNFNGDIGNWDISKVTDMTRLFNGATIFNQDISNWDVSNVTSMNSMFSYATSFNQEINFEKRVKRPPDNMINSLISFCNSIVYTTVLSEIYHTQLTPLVSYLHEPSERRFSLSLDIAEIFKPLIADRLIFTVLNKNMINEDDFEKELNYVYIKDRARKVIIEEFDKRLETTIKHRTLGREVSYRYLIRLELYKLVKHLTGEKEYEGFRIWW